MQHSLQNGFKQLKNGFEEYVFCLKILQLIVLRELSLCQCTKGSSGILQRAAILLE